jgi:hypothetical protein
MPDAPVNVRPAGAADVPAIEAVDAVASSDEGRRGFIAERVAAGQALVALDGDAERACRTPRIFTSTNRSNLPMQRLLEGLGYRLSGMVDDLDPGDPELFYSRGLDDTPLRRGGASGKVFEPIQ